MPVTIKEIAEYTQTSRGTVDKVLHNRAGVKPETRERIMKAIAELDYSPNIIGKALVLKNNPLKIGIIVTPDYNYYIQQVMLGINAAKAEYSPFGITVDVRILKTLTVEEELEVLDDLEREGCAGISVFPFDDERVKQRINELNDRGIAMVTFNSVIGGIEGICFVGQDNYRAGRTAGSLIRRIIRETGTVAVLISSMNISCHEQRLGGFRDKLRECVPNIHIVDVLEEYDDDRLAYECTMQLCRAHSDLDAIYITSGGSVGVCQAIRELGREEHLRVISHDMSPQALPYLKSGLISFSLEQDGYEQGYQLVKVLFEYLLKSQHPEQYNILTPLKIITEELIESL